LIKFCKIKIIKVPLDFKTQEKNELSYITGLLKLIKKSSLFVSLSGTF